MRTPIVNFSNAGACKVTSVTKPAQAKSGAFYVTVSIDAPSVMQSGAIRYQNYRVQAYEEHPSYAEIAGLQKGDQVCVTATMTQTASGTFYGLDTFSRFQGRKMDASKLAQFSE